MSSFGFVYVLVKLLNLLVSCRCFSPMGDKWWMKDTRLHVGKLEITNRKVNGWFTFASLHKG